MNNEEKILSILEVLAFEVKEIKSKVDKLETRFDVLETKVDKLETRFDVLETKVDKLETRFDALETKVDKLDIRMDAAEKQAARNLDFIIDEFERSDKRILGYLENMALNEAGEQAKASLGLV